MAALRRSLDAVLPARAAANSGDAVFPSSVLAGLTSESARTLPDASMMVARAPAAWPSCAASSARECEWSLSTWRAKSRVFWVRLRSISWRSEVSHALPSTKSMVMAVAAMTSRKTARSLKKMRFFTLSSLRGLEAVAGAAHGLEIAGIFRVGLDLLADAADVNVDRARGDVGGVAPDGVEKVIAGKHASLVAREIIEQAELGGGGGYGVAAHGESHGRGIDFDVADLHGTGRKRALEAAQHGFHAGHEFARAERFRDVVVGAEFETENTIGFAALRREKNYGNRGQADRLADVAAEFETVLARDHDVEHE